MKLTPGTLQAASVIAFGAAVVGAQAQTASNVVIYGVIDQAVERLNNVGAAGGSLTRLPGLTGSTASRLGFRGSEDLGAGLSAVFTLEMGFGVDTGTLNQGGRAFGRQSYVGVQAPWGSVTAGRQYSMLTWAMLDSDFLQPNAYGSSSLDSYLPNARADNSLAYRGSFGSIGVGATYSLGRDAVNAGPSPSGTNCPGESGTDTKACRQWSAMVKYDDARWGISAAIDELRGGAGAFAGLTSSGMTDRRSLLAGWTRFGDIKLGAGLVSRRNEASAATPRSQLIYIGAIYNATPQIVLDGQLLKLDFKNSANKATLLALRGTYSLSKRTAIYATAGHIVNDGSLAISASTAAAGSAPAPGENQTGMAVGIRHSF
jgi:predicted porin